MYQLMIAKLSSSLSTAFPVHCEYMVVFRGTLFWLLITTKLEFINSSPPEKDTNAGSKLSHFNMLIHHPFLLKLPFVLLLEREKR